MTWVDEQDNALKQIDKRNRELLDYYLKIDKVERQVHAKPAALAASNSYGNIIDSLLRTDTEGIFMGRSVHGLTFDSNGQQVPTRFGFTIRTCAQDESDFITNGFIARETSETLLMLNLSAWADAFFDVGANVGYYSLLMATAAPSMRVYAFEPVRAVLNRFALSTEENGLTDRIIARCCAVGASAGTGKIRLNRQGTGGSSLCQRRDAPEDDSGITEQVPIVSLDQVAGRIEPKPMRLVVKIDVEGYEGPVLAGGSNLFSAPKAPVILLETFPKRIFGKSHDAEVLARLLGWGYQVYSVEKYRTGRRLVRPAYKWGCLHRSKSGNYIALPPGRNRALELCLKAAKPSSLLSRRRLEDIAKFQDQCFTNAQHYLERLKCESGD